MRTTKKDTRIYIEQYFTYFKMPFHYLNQWELNARFILKRVNLSINLANQSNVQKIKFIVR